MIEKIVSSDNSRTFSDPLDKLLINRAKSAERGNTMSIEDARKKIAEKIGRTISTPK